MYGMIFDFPTLAQTWADLPPVMRDAAFVIGALVIAAALLASHKPTSPRTFRHR